MKLDIKKQIVTYAAAAAMAVGASGCASTLLYDGEFNHPTLDRMKLVRDGANGPDTMNLYDESNAGYDRLVWTIVNDNPIDGMEIGDTEEDSVTIHRSDDVRTTYRKNSVTEFTGEGVSEISFGHEFTTPELRHALANYHKLPGLMTQGASAETNTRSRRGGSTLDTKVAEGLQSMGRIPNKVEFMQILTARQKLAEATVLHGKATDGGISVYAQKKGTHYSH